MILDLNIGHVLPCIANFTIEIPNIHYFRQLFDTGPSQRHRILYTGCWNGFLHFRGKLLIQRQQKDTIFIQNLKCRVSHVQKIWSGVMRFHAMDLAICAKALSSSICPF